MAQPQDVTVEEMIVTIVEGLTQVLGRHLSLVEYDELSGMDRLQLLADIFANLSPEAQSDFSKEPVQQAAGRTAEFLTRTLNYKIPPLVAPSFERDFLNGEKTLLDPILYWVLKRMTENRKRVYLARYLTRIEVPEDMISQDDGIRDLHSRYMQLRQDFIETHKRVESVKEANADPAEARRRIQGLEAERDQLVGILGQAQKKLSGVSNREQLLATCKSLRQEQEDRDKLNQKMADLKLQKVNASRRASELASRLRDVRKDIQENRMDDILRRMHDDIETNRISLEQTLPVELAEKRKQNNELEKLLNNPLDQASLNSELSQLEKECQKLEVEVAERQRPSDDGTNIAVMKQQVARVQKKKAEALGEYNSLAAENQRLMDQMMDRESRLASLRNSKVLKGDDFKRFELEHRQNTRTVNTMKQRLFDLRAEFGVLQYTEKLLKAKHEDLQADLSAIEARLGAKGYVAAAQNLNKVSEEKNIVEQAKGKTLEELSQTVQELVSQIRDRRNKLAPQILELRNLRQNAQVVEQEYNEKKSTYEYQQSFLMQEVVKLESEVGNLASECRLNESLYHRIHTQLRNVKCAHDRVELETQCRSGKQFDDKFRTQGQMFNVVTEQLDARQKELQKKRREIDENHETNLQQVEYFTSLKKLMESKVAVMKKEQEQAQGGGNQQKTTVDQDIRDIMGGTQNRAGVDMLVLGGN